MFVERVSGKPQEQPAAATAGGGAKEARLYARAPESAEKITKIQSVQEKEGICKKKATRWTRGEIHRNEERFRHLSDKVDKNKMDDAEMGAELQGLQAGEERRGCNASQAVDCCLETMVEQIVALGADQAPNFLKKFEAYIPHVQMSEKERGRRNSEYEQEQDKASPQLALSASSGCNEGTPATSLELDLPRFRGALGESGGAGKTGTAKGERKRSLSNSPSRRPMEDDASLEDL